MAGMNDVSGFWDRIVLKHSKVFQELFCSKSEPLCKTSFEALVTVHYSEVGSNQRHKEDETVYAWELFLLDIEGMYCDEMVFSKLGGI